MNSVSQNCAVKIAVRERPVRDSIVKSKEPVICYYPNSNILIVDERPFSFDYVLGPTVTQSQVFDDLVKPLVSYLKQGFNCTALAYGQTGTGKSYTMGLDSINFEGDNVGVIPRCLKEIFTVDDENIDGKNGNNEALISVQKELFASFIEIYNEKVYDLLAENTNEPIIAKGYRYTGGLRKPLTNIHECYAILMQGNKNRHVRPTKMNLQSSRSHAIFTIHLRCISQNMKGDESITSSCMNIVDLAGSEGVRRTGHQGVAMSEGVNINQGLLSIGKVIQAMTMGNKVIPYRDSVLSSVLQDSLNSNSYLTLLACISPHREDLSETLSTLRFAQNAKQLKNTPLVNNIIADIKKNSKVRQTPYKTKQLHSNNVNKATPFNRIHVGMSRVSPKSTIKSNTFCTPKKHRMEFNRCNQTDIACSHNRPKMSNIVMNLPNMGQLESTHNRDSLFNRSMDSNGSVLSLNISSYTAVDCPTLNKGINNNFSPVIRKYMTELETGLKNKFREILERTLHSFIPPQTQASTSRPQLQTPLTTNIRQEIKSVMKEVLSENENVMTTNAKCQLFNSSDELFKIPEIPVDTHVPPKTSSPKSQNDHVSFAETFFAGVTTSDKTDLNKSIKRSRRISERFGIEQSMLLTNDMNLPNENQNNTTRRSSRKSVLESYAQKRMHVDLASHLQIAETHDTLRQPEVTKTPKVNNKSTLKTAKLNNAHYNITSNNLNGTSTSTKLNLNRHRKGILDLLNKGAMKEIQILPMIGQKRAFQIVTQRTLNGKFKTWRQVEKLPIWRGTEWERFAAVNCLV